jgi:integrase/recombinase XerC/integrase/recombinase XerD
MATTTRRSYAQTMNRLTAQHGAQPVGALDGATLDAFTAATWGECGPATWNRHVATLRSFGAFARRRGWLAADPAAVLERRTEPADRTKAIARSSLERLFRRDDVALREKCLWRLLYETAARAQEVLSADIADLDLDNKRLRVRRKGGDSDWLHFQSGAALLEGPWVIRWERCCWRSVIGGRGGVLGRGDRSSRRRSRRWRAGRGV